jgi:hypothetical protein
MKIGFCRSKVSLQARDKTVRTHGSLGSGPYYIKHYDKIDFEYNFTELNLMLYYPLFNRKDFVISPLVGFGFCIVKGVDEDGGIAWIKESEEFFNDGLYHVDYEQYDESSMVFKNSGWTVHLGINLKYKHLFLDCYYSNHPHKMERNTTNYIEINEKMMSFNTSLGIIF